jgi:hypothetical protein
VLFTLYVTPLKNGRTRDIIRITSDITATEYYTSELHVGKVALTFSEEDNETIVLNQNEPNPFIGQTVITYKMPESAKAKFTIYDLNGKQLKTMLLDAVKGMNTITLSKEQLGLSGVLYYTLESGDFTATKKMIILE